MDEEKENIFKKYWINILIVILFIVVGLYVWVNYFTGFTNSLISEVKENIKSEISKNDDFTLKEITLYRDPKDRGKLIGYVKINSSFFKTELTKTCQATLIDKSNYIWECK